ncbi:hypothetical protein BGX21_005832 [Mortierella sp. AD011]|nr:hypothetical protein BGX20_005229 [Mortierella sp. AD010]KAF9369689.1 hypothetical protein BGX21_005832 [Mortierella sp. AD011]
MNSNFHAESLSPPPGTGPGAEEEPGSSPETEEEDLVTTRVVVGRGKKPVLAPKVAVSAPKVAARGTKGTKERFSNENIAVILTWFEHPPNYAKIYGTSGQTTVGKTPTTASKGWEVLAEHFNKKSKGYWDLSGRSMKDRFTRFKNSYKEVREQVFATGFGVTDEDRANGIYKLEHKRESMFFGFDRMEALFGYKPNVNPLSEVDHSLEVVRSCQVERDAIEDVDEEEEQAEGGKDNDVEDTVGFGNEDLSTIDHSFLDNEDDNEADGNDARQTADVGAITGTEVDIASVTSSSSSLRKRAASVSSSSSSRRAPPKLNTGQPKEKSSFALAYIESTEKKVEEWEKEKYESERREKQKDKKLDIKAQLMNTALINGKSIEEVKEMLKLLDDD